ncbi:unnamed protein product [Cuscuta campestris]|uniref:Thioredoxin-like fold domain-containing protein n=1 Tax=Cuscuta campestris TaxID=132261 RepID=A0A484KK34_9ASTE|nr:unnamed protein product [Cuscuta campestris]
MMRKGVTHSLSAYQQFLSCFSCLAVPFEDSVRRERICLALGFDGLPTVAILDPSQEVLYHGPPSMFFRFGGAESDCFPFTLERQEICFGRHCVPRHLSLNELLGLADTNVMCNVLKDASISISELKKEFVWIYLCSECYSLRKLQEVDEECRRQKFELEIVVVCCPFDMGVPPELFEGLIMDQLASLNLLGWWVFPFNNTISQRLNRMRKSLLDGFFIVDPIEEYVDPYGLQIICDFGMDCYPYTRRSLVEKEFQRLRGLSLSSLLLPWTYVCRKDELGPSSITQKPVEEALNKIVLLIYTQRKRKI